MERLQVSFSFDDNLMKKIRVFFIAAAMLMLCGCSQLVDRQIFKKTGFFQTERINASVHMVKDMDSGYVYWEDMSKDGETQINRYTIADGTTSVIFRTTNRVDSYDVEGEWLFYILDETEGSKVHRYNLNSGVEETVYCNEKEERLFCDIYDGYLYIIYNYYYPEQRTYRCPIDGDFDSELENLDDYLPKQYEGDTWKFALDGLTVCADYEEEYGKYVINEIRDTKSGAPVAEHVDEKVKVGDKLVTVKPFSYQVEGEEEKPISCLSDSIYDKSELYQQYMTCEDGKTIIALMSVSKNPNIGCDLAQYEVKRDIIFTIDIQTGESKIIYDTRNNQTRIIGYENGTVYLLKNNFTIYSQPIEGGKLTEITTLPKTAKASFDWQGDYLLIQYIPYEAKTSSSYEIKKVQIKK